VLYKMFSLGAYFLDGTATAAEAMCGQAYGAKDRKAFRRASVIAIEWSLGLGLAASVAFWFAGAQFIDFVTTDAAVRAHAREFLIFAALTPLAGALAFAFDGIYIGATWTRAMRDLMLISLAAFVLVLLLGRDWGNAGLWTAFLVFLAARGFGQGLMYPRLEARRAW
jgi:multidrug resistance protein, MATE family